VVVVVAGGCTAYLQLWIGTRMQKQYGKLGERLFTLAGLPERRLSWECRAAKGKVYNDPSG
jgi:hypothetical protein